MTDREARLQEELKALFAKYAVKLFGYEQYDGDEAYAGYDYYIEGDEIRIPIYELAE